MKYKRQPQPPRDSLLQMLELQREESRQQAEHWLDVTTALQETVDRYMALFAEAPIGYTTLDDKGTIVEMNAAAGELLHVDPQQVAGQPLLAFVNRNEAKLFSRHLFLTSRQGYATTELQLGRINHPSRAVRLTSRRVVMPRSLRARLLTIISDITEQQRREDVVRASEKLHREIVEMAQEGICIVNADNEIIFANPRLGSIVGLPAEALIGRAVSDIADESATLAPLAASESIVHGGQTEQHLRRADGTTVPVSVSTSVMRNEHGQLTGVLRMYSDATARQELNVARDMLVRQLVAAQEGERQRIARELHDQLGQHIVGLSLGLARLAMTMSDEQRELVGLLQRQADLLGRDVHTLAMQLRPSALDHLGLAAAVRAYADEVVERSGLDVDVQCEPWDETGVDSSLQTGLYRIAQEALTNVMKHAHARHVSVILERDRDTLRLIVEDDGRGFDMPQLNRSNDSGLGLAGIRERASIMGGTVTIESAAGTGTTVFVRIPLRSESASEYEQKTSTASGR